MITQTVREGLEAELQTLKARRESMVAKIDSKISAIEAVLAPDDEQQEFPFQVIPAIPIHFHARDESAPLSANTGLSESIQKFIRESGGVLRQEIVDFLARNGIEARGKTPMGTLVTTELWRLQKRGVVIKNGKIFYWKSKEMARFA